MSIDAVSRVRAIRVPDPVSNAEEAAARRARAGTVAAARPVDAATKQRADADALRTVPTTERARRRLGLSALKAPSPP